MPSHTSTSQNDFDLAIVGAGFGGALLAMIARRLGWRVALLEKGRHPRFAIGESSTPLANLLLEELALRYDLPRLLPLCKWGAWQQSYPAIGCGLKRGFTFLHHTPGRAFAGARAEQLLVAASPHDGIADTHWYRPDFDAFFADEAVQSGAEYLDEITLEVPELGPVITLRGTRLGQSHTLRARFLVDATGPRGFLHGALKLGEDDLPDLPPTQALFAHFADVARVEDLASGAFAAAPYPADDAALHHVFEGGWIWVLRFNNGLVSAGVAAQDGLANELNFAQGEAAWQRLLARFPSIGAQFAKARAVTPFVHLPRLSFGSRRIVGENWALLPSAAGFVDPLLSNGFPLTLLGVARIAQLLENTAPGSAPAAEALQGYARQTRDELEITARLVGALYRQMGDFENFSALTLLYFAAASFAETARRLQRPALGGGFLLHNHPQFGPALRACLENAARPSILAAIEPFDVAGLTRGDRANWYPVDAQDLRDAAHKVQASPAEIDALLARCGFAA